MEQFSLKKIDNKNKLNIITSNIIYEYILDMTSSYNFSHHLLHFPI